MLKGVLTNAERHDQMAKSMHLPLLKKKGKFNDRRMTIACYGPSLADTWRQLKHPIMTVSGAHDYLVEKRRYLLISMWIVTPERTKRRC
jgi:hypothetical protein